MGASLSKNKQSANNQSQMQQSVNAPQNAALTNLYGLANGVFNQNQQYVGPGQQTAQNTANRVIDSAVPAWQQQLNGGAYANLGIGNQLMSSLNNSLNTPSAASSLYAQMMGGKGNNYADAMKATFIGDANRARDNMMSTLDARATGSGMSGGSRHGVATALGNYDINSNLQKNLADVGYNTFDKDLNNKLMIAQQADQGTLSRQQMLANLLTQQNGATTGALGMGEGMQNLGLGALAPASAGWGNIQGLSNIIGQPTILSSGSSSGSSSGKSKGNSVGLGSLFG
jgi:hypothetical protein